MDVEDLAHILNKDMKKAEWLKNISIGICEEEVAYRNLPVSTSSEKMFDQIYTFESLEK